MATHVDITAFIRSLEEQYQPRAMQAAARATERFMEAVIGEAQELCPVKTGALKASGTTEEAVIEGDNISVQGGFNTSYAAAVHEILTNHHSQGQAKYLEQPLTQMAPKLPDYVLAELQKEFGS